MAELDQKIEGILLQRLTQMIQVWCTEFDRTEDGDGRRDPLPLRDATNKRRGDKRLKDEKVRAKSFEKCNDMLIIVAVTRGPYDAEAHRP